MNALEAATKSIKELLTEVQADLQSLIAKVSAEFDEDSEFLSMLNQADDALDEAVTAYESAGQDEGEGSEE